MSPITNGFVAPGFEPVAEAFERNCTEHGDVGAAFAVYQHGKLVVDLYGGIADSATGKPWAEDTIQVIFSGTKGLVATCLAILIDRGQLNIDAPVSAYWPEFARNGKEGVLVRHIASHTAGLPGIRKRTVTMDEVLDSRLMASYLEDEEPVWEPGSTWCYHALTYGWLCGEVIRRIDGRPVGQFFAEEVASPLGLTDTWIGLPPEQDHRVAKLEVQPTWGKTVLSDPSQIVQDPIRKAIWANPLLLGPEQLAWWNGPALFRAGVPGGGGVAHVRDMARLYSCLALGGEIDGVRLVRPETIQVVTQGFGEGIDPASDMPGAHGIGFAIQQPNREIGPPVFEFGHGGAGGSAHYAWPAFGVGYSYAMNQMRDDELDPRALGVVAALYEVLTR